MKHIFSVSNRFKEKQNVLKILFDTWKKGEDGTNFGQTITDLGRSVSSLDLLSKSGLTKETLDFVIIYLKNQGFINMFAEDQDKNQKNHKWIITDLGKEAYADNKFTNERGNFYRKLFLQLVGLLIAVGSLLWSISNSRQNSTIERKVEYLEKELYKLQPNSQQ